MRAEAGPTPKTGPATGADGKADSPRVSGHEGLAAQPWSAHENVWLRDGAVQLRGVLSAKACRRLIDLYAEPERFRSRIVMERYQFGRGEYSYFDYPLPDLVSELREQLYTQLVPWANRMMETLGAAERYPRTLAEFLHHCHAAGQSRPTPLMLKYEAGDFNCLHRDIYGPTAFPLQAALFLSDPDTDYDGGEFVLVENRPRQQARTRVYRPGIGDIVIFANDVRPAQGVKKMLRANVRHGVSEVTRGQRWVLGLIFHDAQ